MYLRESTSSVHALAVDATLLLEDDGEALARGLGLVEVLPEIEEGDVEPGLAVVALVLDRSDARRFGP